MPKASDDEMTREEMKAHTNAVGQAKKDIAAAVKTFKAGVKSGDVAHAKDELNEAVVKVNRILEGDRVGHEKVRAALKLINKTKGGTRRRRQRGCSGGARHTRRG